MELTKFPKRVFILGAGASVASGAPLMKEFLDRAEDYYRNEKVDTGYNEHFRRVFRALDLMQPMHSKANINLDNIEDVFGAFEIAGLVKRLGGLTEKEIAALSLSTKILITHTLELATTFSINSGNIIPNDDYLRLVRDLLSEMSQPFENNTFITFNYDVCLDFYLHMKGFYIDYGLKENLIALDQPSARLFKIHGSINWSICPQCKEMFAVPWPDYMKKFDKGTQIARTTTLHFTHDYHEFKPCQKCTVAPNLFEPAIIPPTWNKTNFHSQIGHVWKHAANALAEAEHIYVIGYSLPETDMFFRLLYAIGSVSERRLKRFWVFNPDETAKPRFDEITGKSRMHRYEFIKVNFGQALLKKLIIAPEQVSSLPQETNGARFIPK